MNALHRLPSPSQYEESLCLALLLVNILCCYLQCITLAREDELIELRHFIRNIDVVLHVRDSHSVQHHRLETNKNRESVVCINYYCPCRVPLLLEVNLQFQGKFPATTRQRACMPYFLLRLDSAAFRGIYQDRLSSSLDPR
jgi:hypothetical protein